MPSVYTHFLIARQSFLALPPRIQAKIAPHMHLYYFGAQGADFCFFYKFLRRKNGNLGSHLHRKGGLNTFQCLQTHAAQSSAIFAYAAGYITHYAADTILHPYVYAASGTSILVHTRLESALDYEYGKTYAKAAWEDYKRYFRPKLDKDEKQTLYALYAEKLPQNAVFRFRREGDKIKRFGGGTKSLKKFFNEKEISPKEREKIPLIAEKDGQEVFAVCGAEISERVKVDETTKSVLYITTKKKEKYE